LLYISIGEVGAVRSWPWAQVTEKD